MDLHKKEVTEAQTEDPRRIEKRLARGLEDVSYLFLSQSSNSAGDGIEGRKILPEKTSQESVQQKTPFLLHSFPAVNRDLLMPLLHKDAAVLEEGMHAIDANVPCDPFGSIDLVALDSLDQLCIVNIDTAQNDESLLRGIAHFDWIVRNTPIVRRMYHGRVINFSAAPRLFLVAPGFSPLLQCVAQRIANPKVFCFGYRTASASGGVGILFERCSSNV